MDHGRVNPQFRLEDQGDHGLGNVYYNLIEPALVEAAVKRAKAGWGRAGRSL
jgi:phosphoenolpyruvate carboxykinase (ATP)